MIVRQKIKSLSPGTVRELIDDCWFASDARYQAHQAILRLEKRVAVLQEDRKDMETLHLAGLEQQDEIDALTRRVESCRAYTAQLQQFYTAKSAEVFRLSNENSILRRDCHLLLTERQLDRAALDAKTREIAELKQDIEMLNSAGLDATEEAIREKFWRDHYYTKWNKLRPLVERICMFDLRGPFARAVHRLKHLFSHFEFFDSRML